MGLTADPGETCLETLLTNLRPVLHPEPFVFVSLPPSAAVPPGVLSVFREKEGLSIILPRADANRLGISYSSVWAMITLQVHSNLAAVGLLATLLPPLAAAGISVNPVAAYYHDHLFVPWDRRSEALEMLNELHRDYSGR
jgi:hypothetical protein